MRLDIPKPMTGQKIVENFLRAAHYQESAEVRWEAVDFEDATGNRGAIAYPCQRKKRFWFFDPDRWARDPNAVIFLHPLNPVETYDEIKVEARQASFPRPPITSEVYDEWWKKYHYLHRQLGIILKNAFLIE